MTRISPILLLLLISFTCFAGPVQDIGIQGGIVVHLNCGDGKATIEMAAGNKCLVHGLDKDAGNVNKARAFIQSRKLYGRVSVARYDGRTLPYCDNLINLIVADSIDDVPMSEINRVLVPKGTAIIGGKKTVKPWPNNIDDWPQYLNKADNNAVAMDSVVGPPRRFQWTDKPLWSRSHMGIATVTSLVSSNGRLFSIEDRALPDNPFLPGRFMFVARDAFNGRTLWERKIERWEAITIYIKCLPTQQQRRMVATDDILYCTPVLEGPLAALDAATGKTIKTYKEISPVQEVAYDQGIVFVNVGDRFNAGAYNQTNKKGPKNGAGTAGEPFCGSGFRKGYALEIRDKATPTSSIVAIDPESGRQLWKKSNLKNYTGASFSVKGKHAVYQTGEGLHCINPKTGAEIWAVKKSVTNRKGHDSKTPGTLPNTVIITDEYAFAVEGGEVVGYSLKDGKVLWKTAASGNYQASVDLFYVNGILWTGAKAGATGIDPKTGKVVRSIKQQVTGPMGHDRCYRNYITQKFYINSKTGGTDFLDLEKKKEYPNHWTRGTCGMGVLPANGLVYSSPYSCTCCLGDSMIGINAFSADPQLLKTNDSSLIKRSARLEKGAAYGKVSGSDAAANDWPTYRGNSFRGGMTKTAVTAPLNTKWKTKLPGNPTATTIAAGKVYVCTPDSHTLHALDSNSGKSVWTFTADARIDSPPTYHKGMLLFGGRDGWLYCLRASDGKLVWRFKDLPDRMVGAFGQLESAWPVTGSVLVLDGKVYAAAGRSSFLDGGMFLYCLDPATGKVLKSRSVFGPFAKDTGFPIGYKATPGVGGGRDGARRRRGLKKKKGNEAAHPKTASTRVPGFKNDMLVSDGTNIYIRHVAFGKDLTNSKAPGKRVMPLSGFLDRRVQHRTGYILSDRFEWWKNDPKDILISDGKKAFAVSGFRSRHNHAYFDPRTKGYSLVGNDVEVKLPINGRGLTMAGDVILVAGEQMKFKAPSWEKYEAAYSGRSGGHLLALSATDGKELGNYKLHASPVWDSITVARGNVYISLRDGTIQCMGK